MSDAFPARNITYDELTSWAGSIGIGENHPATDYLNYINTTYPEADLSDAMIEYSSAYLDFDTNADGTYNVWGYRTNYGTSSQYNPIDSNSGQVARSEFRQAVNSGTTVSEGQTVKNFSTQPASGGFAQNAVYALASIGQAACCASVGVGLGKFVDQTLYNLNPDYWDSIGLATLNPETWGSLTLGSDSPFAGMLNAILGINPANGQSQMYIDQDAYAYIAWAMSQAGLFIPPSYGVTEKPEDFTLSTIPIPFSAGTFSGDGSISYGTYATPLTTINVTCSGTWVAVLVDMAFSGGHSGFVFGAIASYSPISIVGSSARVYTTTYNGQTIYYIREAIGEAGYNAALKSSTVPSNPVTYQPSSTELGNSAILALINGHQESTVDGITNQPNATLPDDSSWTTYQDVLPSLQQQYPSIFSNPLTFETMQPDGTVVQHKYVPISVPDISYNNDPQPTATTQLQNQTLVDPTTSTDTLLQLLTDLVTAPKTQTQPQEQIPPNNPIDTGTGSSPTPVPPSGSASALWSVYHPTQAQVDAFGGWLWSTNFVDQLLKVFENPMDAIISLHKVFITPVDAGISTIHAGHLDSNVPSAYVTQQYVSVDCGTVNCYEQFGNVFDYIGTTINLYLPFIGIVPLNVDDVMRSKIHITYSCDLFTGAILAQVEIKRDGYNAVLYQYGGDGAVMYPVSGSRSSSFLTGLMATLGAAASIAVTGGASIPVIAAGVGGAVASTQKQVQRSGGFSGNSGAMGCKVPYLIIERPQTKTASLFPKLEGYPTNYSVILGNCSNHVVCSSVHVNGISATQQELIMIEEFLRSGVEI